MKRKLKSMLALLLCLALCAAMPISLSAAAEDTDDQATARAELIAAWQALTKDVTEVVAVPNASYTGTDGNVYTRSEVAIEEACSTYGLAGVDQLGPLWVNNMAMDSTAWKVFTFQILDGTVDMTQYKSVYVWFMSTLNGTPVPIKMLTQVNNAATVYANVDSARWGKAGFNCSNTAGNTLSLVATEAGDIGGGQKYSGERSHLSFGSVMGVRTVTAGCPADAAEMEYTALVAAAQNVDTEGYAADLVAAFDTALLNAVILTETEGEEAAKIDLLKAWSELSFTYTDVIAVPVAAGYKLDGEEPTLPTEVTKDTKVAGLADPSVLGPYFIDKAPYRTTGWTYQIGVTMQITPVDLSKYDTLNWYAVAYKADGVTVAPLKFNVQVNSGNSRYYEVRQWGNIQPAKVAGANSIKFIGEEKLDGNTDYGFISFGSVWGTRTEAAVIPANAVQMSLDEVYEAAKAVDLTDCSSGKDAFETALDAAYDALHPAEAAVAADLIAAWNGLYNIQYTSLSYPTCGGLTATGELPAALGLTAEQIRLLGPKYSTTVNSGSATYDPPIAPMKGVNLAGLYDYLTLSYYHKGYANQINMAYDPGGSNWDNKILDWAYIDGTKFGTYTWDTTTTNAAMAALLNGTKTVNGMRLEISSGSADTLYLGTLMGVKNVHAQAPTGLTLSELFEAAKAVDTTAFECGADAFVAALDAAHAYLYPEAAPVLEAWANLSETHEVKESVAYPHEAYTGGDGETYSRKAVDETTAAASGLTDTSVLGDYWMEKLYHPGKYPDFEIKKTDMSVYKSLNFYFVGYTAEGAMTYSKLETQINHGNVSWYEGSAAGWSAASFAKFSSVTNLDNLKWAKNAGSFVYISFGSVVGVKDVTTYAEIPAAVRYADTATILAAAGKVDTAPYDTGVAAFRETLDETYATLFPEAAQVLEAWGAMTEMENQQTILARPTKEQGAKPVDETTAAAAGLSAENVAKLGDTWVEKMPYNAKAYGTNTLTAISLKTSGYDSLDFMVVGYNENMEPAWMKVECMRNWGNKPSLNKEITNWTNVGFPSSDNIEAFQFRESYGVTTTSVQYISFGCVVGNKMVEVPVEIPAELKYGDPEAILAAAQALDLTQYGNTDAFAEAVGELDADENPTVIDQGDTDKGIITFDAKAPAAGATVVATPAPAAGYQVKAGSLKVYDENGSVIGLTQRVGFRTDLTAGALDNGFAFQMPEGAAYVGAEYIKDTEPNMGLVGFSVNEAKQGLRGVYRMYVQQEGEDAYTANIGGSKVEVAQFGILICTQKTAKSLRALTLDKVNDGTVKKVECIGSRYRYDVCKDYQDVSVTVTGLNNEAKQTAPFCMRGYIQAKDGTVYYTDVASRSYSEYVH